MTKTIINTTEAPAPIGPYNQAIMVNNMLFISGQIPMDAATGQIVTGNIADETHQSMKNLQSILKEAGLNFTNVVKTTIFLSDMALFAQVNEAYGSYFTSDYPARETVAVKGLPRNVNVEISMIAAS